jgi:hypothetical protein
LPAVLENDTVGWVVLTPVLCLIARSARCAFRAWRPPCSSSREKPETSHQTLTELCTSPTADSIMRTVSASQFGS